MADWSEMMRMPLRDLRIGGSIVFGSGLSCALDGDMLFSLVIEEGAGGALSPGCVLSAGCTLDLVNDQGQWNPGGSLRGAHELIGATLMPKLGVQDGDDTIWRDLGVFQVESAMALEGEGIMRLQGQDSIASELSNTFVDGLTYPQTLNGLWHYALAQSRYVFSGTVPGGSGIINAAPDWKGASLRAVLGYIAAAAGCFVQVDRQGSLQLKPLWNAEKVPVSIDANAYLKLEGDDLHYGPVDALQLTCAGNDQTHIYLSGEGVCPIRVAGNPLFMEGAAALDALAQGMLGRIAGFETQAMRFNWRGDPELQIGDRVHIYAMDASIHEGVLSRQTLRYDGAFSAVCACDVPSDFSCGVQRAITPEGGLNASKLVGSISGSMIQSGSVTADKLAEGSLSADLIAAGSITADKLAAGSITSDKIAAGSITADKLAAGSVLADKIAANSITTSKLQAGSVTAGKIAAGTIETGSLNAVTAKIESLTANSISTDRLAAAMAAFTVITAGTADFDRATIAHLVTQAMNLEFGTAGEVFIRNLRVIYAQMVSAAIGNLVIKASDGSYYQIDVDANGNVTAAPCAVTSGEIAAGITDAGRVILQTDITAESLSTSNLLATYALVNKIDAARIDVDQLWAREAFIDHLNTADISSNGSITIIAGKADAAAGNASAAADNASAAVSVAADAQSAAVDAASAAANAGQLASAALPKTDFQRVLRIDEGGLHVGDNQTSSEVLIDSSSVNMCLNGQVFSSFAANYVEFGSYQLRRTADGGLAFKMR